MQAKSYAHTVWRNVMPTAKEAQMHLLSDTPTPRVRGEDQDPEFSSEPMPAAFSACLFLGVGLLACALFALLW